MFIYLYYIISYSFGVTSHIFFLLNKYLKIVVYI